MVKKQRSNRRRFLQLCGTAAIGAVAGCSSGGSDATTRSTQSETSTTMAPTNTSTTTAEPTKSAYRIENLQGPTQGDDLPQDPKPLDGYPPDFQKQPKKRSIKTSSFQTISVEGAQVPLVPADVAYYWYARGEARFADARSKSAYEVSHVFGAVLSPAEGDSGGTDPVTNWPKQDRIVTYCHCPHHLSSLRAAALIKNGYQNVFAIDEGYQAWIDRKYPLAGKDVGYDHAVRTITGRTPKKFAGKTAWAFHVGSDQKEATKIGADGSYVLKLKFVNVTDQSRIRIDTPAYTITRTLGTLTGGTITADGTVTADGSTSGAGSNSTATNTTSGTTASNTTYGATER